MSNQKNSIIMKNFFAIAALVAVMSVLSAFTANAQVINPQAQSGAEIQNPKWFWVGDTFFEWTDELLIVTSIQSKDAPVRLSQPVLQKDGSFTDTPPRNIFTHVYNPVTGWENERPIVIGSQGRPESYMVAEKTYTEYVNNAINSGDYYEVPNKNGFIDTAIDYLVYDVKVEKGKVSLRIHSVTYTDGEETGDKTLFEHTYVLETNR